MYPDRGQDVRSNPRYFHVRKHNCELNLLSRFRTSPNKMGAFLPTSIATWTWRQAELARAERKPSTMTAAVQQLIALSLHRVDGSCVKIEVEPGTTAADILDREASKPPAGCCARLVTETAQALAPSSQIWQAQAVLSGA